MDELTLSALGATMLLGAAALWIALSDRRRQRLQDRLKAVALATRPIEEVEPRLTLRRRRSGRGAVGLFQLPLLLWKQMDVEFEAAGKSIGMAHLLIAGGVATVLVFFFTTRLVGLNPALALLIGAALAPVTAFAVMRLAQARYRERFLDKFPDALDLICRAVRAGLPVVEAMTVAAAEIGDPVGVEMRRTLDEMHLGVTATAPTMPVTCVFAPAASATGVREELLLIGKPWKKPAARLAAPRPTISWLGSTGARSRAA